MALGALALMVAIPLAFQYGCALLTPKPIPATRARCERALDWLEYHDGRRGERCVELKDGGWAIWNPETRAIIN